MEEMIKCFLSSDDGDGDGDGYGNGDGDGNGYGYGYGYGNGYGYGYGYGDGNGDGNGDGYGDGNGDGDGDGDGDGYGDYIVKHFCGRPVYRIDGVYSLLYHVKLDDDYNGIAVGKILHNDFTTEHTYIVKRNGLFAHGKTIDEAVAAVMDKVLLNSPVEQHIDAFVEEFPLVDSFAPARVLFDWHHRLTGSCRQGRENFCREQGVNMDDEYTIVQFISMTQNSYGGDIMRQLRERYLAIQCKEGVKEYEDAEKSHGE